MKAAIIESAVTIPSYCEFAEPVVDERREVVSLIAAGIHPVVRSLAAGRHYGSHGVWTMVPGVDAVARKADGTLIFTGRVAAPFGTMAERMAVPGGTELPDGADPVQVAAAMNSGLASWVPLLGRLNEIESLRTVLVLGATGTAGLLAVQLASSA